MNFRLPGESGFALVVDCFRDEDDDGEGGEAGEGGLEPEDVAPADEVDDDACDEPVTSQSAHPIDGLEANVAKLTVP